MASRKNTSKKERILEQIKNILMKRNEILFAYVHGSFLDKSPYHDIDIALYVIPEVVDCLDSFDYSRGLFAELEKKMGLEIDAKVMNNASLGFRHSVFKNGRLLFSKDENLRLELMEKDSLEYMDFYELSLQFIRDSVS